jgi:hypothetical protein
VGQRATRSTRTTRGTFPLFSSSTSPPLPLFPSFPFVLILILPLSHSVGWVFTGLLLTKSMIGALDFSTKRLLLFVLFPDRLPLSSRRSRCPHHSRHLTSPGSHSWSHRHPRLRCHDHLVVRSHAFFLIFFAHSYPSLLSATGTSASSSSTTRKSVRRLHRSFFPPSPADPSPSPQDSLSDCGRLMFGRAGSISFGVAYWLFCVFVAGSAMIGEFPPLSFFSFAPTPFGLLRYSLTSPFDRYLDRFQRHLPSWHLHGRLRPCRRPHYPTFRLHASSRKPQVAFLGAFALSL